MPRTHYDILGVGLNATPHAIRSAYRSKAKALHPDAKPTGQSTAPAAVGDTQEFARIAQAYEVLSDPARRACYDRELRDAEARRAAGQWGTADAGRSGSYPHSGGPHSGGGVPHFTWTNIASRSPADTVVGFEDEPHEPEPVKSSRNGSGPARKAYERVDLGVGDDVNVGQPVTRNGQKRKPHTEFDEMYDAFFGAIAKADSTPQGQLRSERPEIGGQEV